MESLVERFRRNFGMAISCAPREEAIRFQWKECRDRGFLLPPGVLFKLNRDHEVLAFDCSEQGQVLEETTTTGIHSVTTQFEWGDSSIGKQVKLSTAHNFNAENNLASLYTNSLKRGWLFSVNFLHHFASQSTFSTNFCSGSFNNSTMQLELAQTKGNMSAKLNAEADFETGQKTLKLLGENVLGPSTLSINCLIKDFRALSSWSLSTVTTITSSTSFSSSYESGSNLSRHGVFKLAQKFRSLSLASTISSTDEGHSICMEATKELSGDREVTLMYQMSPWLHFNASNICFSEKNQHSFSYRNEALSGHSIELNFKQELCTKHSYAMRISAGQTDFSIFTEVTIPVM